MKTVRILVLLLHIVVSLADAKKRGKKQEQKNLNINLQKCNLRKEYWNENFPATLKAVVRLRPESTDKNVTGFVFFEQQTFRRPTKIYGWVNGLDRGAKHGMFITAKGMAGCNWRSRMSAHYNPYDSSHGESKDCERHVGDLEYLVSNSKGVADFAQMDPRINLQGPTSVIGRNLVVMFKQDDNTYENSTRVACGVISFARRSNWSRTDYVVPGPENGYTYIYGLIVSIITVLVFLHYVRKEHNELNKHAPTFPNQKIKQIHQRRVIRKRKYLAR